MPKQLGLFGRKGLRKQRRGQAVAPALPKNPAFAEAMRDAADIREWTDHPRATQWRIYRLAQALTDGR